MAVAIWFVPDNATVSALSFSSSLTTATGRRFVVLGGTGKIGTAVATHLLSRAPPQSEIILVGRRNIDEAVQEVKLQDTGDEGSVVKGVQVNDVWDTQDKVLRRVFESADCIIHTAGPFLDRSPTTLKLAMEYNVPVYVDVSDPLPFLEASLLQNHTAATQSGTTALLAAGAFPGMSNVLAMEAAGALKGDDRVVQNCYFSYFTSGLGGSGTLNLYITNLGFGEPIVQYDAGELRFFPAFSGRLLGTVDFKLPKEEGVVVNKAAKGGGFGMDAMERRVGTKQVFSWPFPEAATVPVELRARGSSLACMGTAPDIWNDMLGLLVEVIPRSWWRNRRFSQLLADFSEPLVWLSGTFLKLQDKDDNLGEIHAMRVDVTRSDGSGVSIWQGHASFRQCVAQSCAELALDCLEHSAPGVRLPEQRYRNPVDRERILKRLTQTPGTFCYSGPVGLGHIRPPTRMDEAIDKAVSEEMAS
eukprot:scaffold18208_cov182-Amphora_coffeaeformis.AAC.2